MARVAGGVAAGEFYMMLIRVTLMAVCLACGQALAVAQDKGGGAPSRVRAVSLREVGRHAEAFTPDTLKLARVVLEDFRPVEDDWVHVFQLYEPGSKTRRGEMFNGRPFEAHSFLICTDAEIGKPLLERKGEWLSRSVNLYLRTYDMGLTTNMYVGYVTRVELLDERGEVIDAISSKAWDEDSAARQRQSPGR